MLEVSAENTVVTYQLLPYVNSHFAYHIFGDFFKNTTPDKVIIESIIVILFTLFTIFMISSIVRSILKVILNHFRLEPISVKHELELISINKNTLRPIQHKDFPDNDQNIAEVPAHKLAKNGLFRVVEIRKIGKIYTVKEYCIFDVLSYVKDLTELGRLLSDYTRLTHYCRPVRVFYINTKLGKHLLIKQKIRNNGLIFSPHRVFKNITLDEKLNYLRNLISKSVVLVRAYDSGLCRPASYFYVPVNELKSIREFKEIIDSHYV